MPNILRNINISILSEPVPDRTFNNKVKSFSIKNFRANGITTPAYKDFMFAYTFRVNYFSGVMNEAQADKIIQLLESINKKLEIVKRPPRDAPEGVIKQGPQKTTVARLLLGISDKISESQPSGSTEP